MNFALNYPEYVSKLVVVDVAPVAYVPEGLRNITQSLMKLDLASIRSRKDADQMLSEDIAVRYILSHLTVPESTHTRLFIDELGPRRVQIPVENKPQAFQRSSRRDREEPGTQPSPFQPFFLPRRNLIYRRNSFAIHPAVHA